ncbi:DUF1850 domain-containing protein [Mongoliimonas terrestris]|uniref:DUF1850 domain-containing protein n=1 Tax=Mongoliimonas terrestris TaxID=1709001 RepID=UPI000949977F|nr:DUF1850 domain-containing protein [Mongoliimonas terrestris]
MSALCLAGGGALVKIAATAFTLGFVHSIEKIPIVDAFVVAADGLTLVESRIKGSGAGTEPAPDARLQDGWYVWTPADGHRDALVLRRSGVSGTGDWTLCANGACRPLGALLPQGADPVTLTACP